MAKRFPHYSAENLPPITTYQSVPLDLHPANVAKVAEAEALSHKPIDVWQLKNHCCAARQVQYI